ncbi:hypothetical protein DFO70_13114 [Cytobacillus firmus]|uniref:Uncharacterized protein n=2 Tax=Cytobacillus TaxID=2675230 RepID=A0A366JIJ0_CYTFI|nr:hypothetical protein [Cytobacillus firmus]RBP86181.1 hypothetical protein DFO70_13114 [Cytobacillus firmus]TDX36406.1 hypothetical protein DFO72_12023 [Cytobacillus oceanisediminis]
MGILYETLVDESLLELFEVVMLELSAAFSNSSKFLFVVPFSPNAHKPSYGRFNKVFTLLSSDV